MSISIHKTLLSIARKHNSQLHFLIEKNGVIYLRGQKEGELFTFLARTIVGQQLSKAAATTIWKRLITYANSQNLSIFDISSSNHKKEIASCGLSANKTKALLLLRDSIEERCMTAEQIYKSEYQEIVDIITHFWGLGRWSADMVAIFFACKPDVWPSSDAALVRGLQLLERTRAPDDLASEFAPYRTYLARHIWKGVDAGIVS